MIKLFSNPLGDLYREQQTFFCSVWCFCHAFCVLYVIVWYFQNCSHELLMIVVINSCLAVEFLQPLRYNCLFFLMSGPAEALFQREYYSLLKAALRRGGIIASQGM